MAASRVIWLVFVTCTAQSTLDSAMRRDDECSGQHQDACTLAMLQRRQDAEQEGSLAVAPDEEGASAMTTEESKVSAEAPAGAERRHRPAVFTAAKRAEETEDLLKPNNTEGRDHAYTPSDSIVGVPEVPWSTARVDQKANAMNISKHSQSSADNSSDIDLPEAPAAGNITEPAELANAKSPEVSKPEVIRAANLPEPITVTLIPDPGPPMQPEEMPSSSAEETPPSAEEVVQPPDEEEVPLLPAAEEMPDEAHQMTMQASAEAAAEAEAIAEAAAVAEEEAEAEARTQAEEQDEDEAEAEAEARAVAESETVNMPDSEDFGAAQLNALGYLLPIAEESLDLREFEDFGA